MKQGVREFLQTKAGYAICLALMVVALGAIVMSFKSVFGQSEAAAANNTRVMVCSETGKSFSIEIKPGMTFPVKSPYSGKATGYPANEVCNWTEDGQVSSTPTYVLLNKTVGLKGPTFCPVCHRLVVKDNPAAVAGHKPPPTEAEYAASKEKHVEEASD